MKTEAISLINFILFKQERFNNKSLFKGYAELTRYLMKSKIDNNPFSKFSSEKSVLQTIYSTLKGKYNLKKKKDFLRLAIIHRMEEMNVASQDNIYYLEQVLNQHEKFFVQAKEGNVNFLSLYGDIDVAEKKETSASKTNVEVKKQEKHNKKETRVRIDRNERRENQEGGFSETEFLNAMEIVFSKYKKVNPKTFIKVLEFMKNF